LPFYKIFLYGLLERFSDRKGKLYTKLHIEIFSEKRLVLTPGTYKLKARRWNFIFPVVQEKHVEIYGNVRTNINVIYDAGSKSLLIR